MSEVGYFGDVRTRYVHLTKELYWTLQEWKMDGKIEVGADFNNHHLPNELDSIILSILGYKDARDLVENWKPEHVQTVELLGSPHGWTIYQMILARKKNDAG